VIFKNTNKIATSRHHSSVEDVHFLILPPSGLGPRRTPTPPIHPLFFDTSHTGVRPRTSWKQHQQQFIYHCQGDKSVLTFRQFSWWLLQRRLTATSCHWTRLCTFTQKQSH